MQTFKLILKLYKSHKGPLLIVFSIFMGIAIVMSSLNSSNSADAFSSTTLQIGIVDEGDGTLSTTIKNYYNNEHEFKEISYDEKEIVNELYWKCLDYVLFIPKGADQQFISSNKEIELKCMKVPGHSANGLFETELKMYLTKLQSLLLAGYSLEEAECELISLKQDTTKVIVAKQVNENCQDKLSRFLMYLPYLFIAICVEGIGFILLIVNEKEVKERVECSASSMKKRTAGITFGILFLGLAIFICSYTVAALLSKGSIFIDPRTPYFILNSFVLLLFSLSLGFLVGMIAKSTVSLTGYQNIFALTLCFLGGVFVPQEVLGETALKVGRLLPTYWYIVSTKEISSMLTVTKQFQKEIFMNSTLIFAYAVAIFALAMVVMSAKRAKTV